MPTHEELLQQAATEVDHAEGYISDAEFREEYEERVVRYLQANAHTMLAIYRQNQVIIDLMGKQEEGPGALR